MKLSVCVTTHLRPEGLDRTLASVAAQTRPPDEMIVSDNASPVATSEVAAKWEPRFRRFVFRRNETDIGMPGNLNVAIRATSGEYVANLHDGDVYEPTLLARWEAALDRFPSAGFVFCGLSNESHPAKKLRGVVLHDIPPLTDGRVFLERFLFGSTSSPVWGTVMARRAAYGELLPFDPAFGIWADVDMWMRMCLRFDVAYVREPLIHLDYTPSEHRKPGWYNWQAYRTVREIFRVNIERAFGDDPGRRERELRAHRALWDRFLVARLLGRLRALDWEGLKDGLAVAKEMGVPRRWISDAPV